MNFLYLYLLQSFLQLEWYFILCFLYYSVVWFVFSDSLTNHHAKVLVGLEEERKGVERQRREELKYFRQQQAAEKAQKEAIDRSHWSTANDMNSTFLKFAGQDEDKDKRVKAQQQQQADWITRQLHIQAEKEARERQDEA